MMPCSYIECTSGLPGRNEPCLLLWPEGRDHSKFKPDQLRFAGIVLCDKCANMSVAEDFISDEGWNQIKVTYHEVGKLQPDRAAVKLAWNPPTNANVPPQLPSHLSS